MQTSEHNRLFIEAAQSLKDAANEKQPTLTTEHIETILRAVVRLTDRYGGPPNDLEAFTQWALQIVEPGADLLFALSTFTGEHIKIVRWSIRKVLAGCFDLGVDSSTFKEIEARVWARVFETLPEWLTPAYSKTPGHSPASLKTRLYAYAYLVAMGWKTEQLRNRAKHASIKSLEDFRKPSERYRVILGPGDTGAYDPEPPVELEPWEIPIDSENLSTKKNVETLFA